MKPKQFCDSNCTSEKNSEVPRNKQIGKDESQKGINAVYIEFILQVQSRRRDSGTVLNKIQSKSLYFMSRSKIVEILLVLLS